MHFLFLIIVLLVLLMPNICIKTCNSLPESVYGGTLYSKIYINQSGMDSVIIRCAEHGYLGPYAEVYNFQVMGLGSGSFLKNSFPSFIVDFSICHFSRYLKN